MTRQVRLDDLIDRSTEPHASFHDAELLSLNIDNEARTAVAAFELFVGDPDGDREQRESVRRGRLELGGLRFWAEEMPDPHYLREVTLNRPITTWDDLMSEASDERHGSSPIRFQMTPSHGRCTLRRRTSARTSPLVTPDSRACEVTFAVVESGRHDVQKAGLGMFLLPPERSAGREARGRTPRVHL